MSTVTDKIDLTAPGDDAGTTVELAVYELDAQRVLDAVGHGPAMPIRDVHDITDHDTACGQRISYAGGSATLPTIACTRSGCCWSRPGCLAVSCAVCAGPTSTWTRYDWPCVRPSP